MDFSLVKSLTIPEGKVKQIDVGGVTVWENGPAVIPDYLCFTAEEAGSTIEIAVNGSAPTLSLETSPNGTSWTPFVAGTTVITLQNIGDKVFFRGNNDKFSSSVKNYNKFVISGKTAASGNIMSLLDSTVTMTELTQTYIFIAMFEDCTSLTAAPELPATTLANYCYNNMFSGCTSLTAAPELPATTLASYCYQSMFKDCTSLTAAPELPATTLASYCYNNMFKDCTSLTAAPELPAITLASDCCNSMFYGCTSLTAAPELPATTLASYCYNDMFYKCASLLEAPYLPATTLSDYCYKGMFRECSSLETAPDLPAASLVDGCYAYIFDNCNSLKSLRVGFTSWPEHNTFYWLHNVSPTGDFYCPASLSSVYGDNRIPTGWTVHHTSVPDVTEIGTLVNVDGIEAMYVGKVENVGKLVIMTNNLGADDKNIVGNAYSLGDLQELKKSKAFKDGWRLPTEEEMNFLAKNSELMGFGSTVCTFGEGNLYFHYTQDVEGGKRESRHWLADEQSCFWFRSDNKYGRTTTDHTAVDEFYVRLVKVFQ